MDIRTRLGHRKVVSAIGSDGMGQIHKASVMHVGRARHGNEP